ncbi:hypothetical protein NPIL_258591 [Nephila pilipes]|uniref:Uncharacterized protein n=1 Tax=Nephila pilipes TaxID=299642 RepID=A0A8X6QHH3_NEPPI|nr:hypothetical protein NPIL_258591 [Nephila pilipes]
MVNHPKHQKNLQLKTKKRSRGPIQINDKPWLPWRASKKDTCSHINIYLSCKSGINNSNHFPDCIKLDRAAQEQRAHLRLYWETRDLMD